MNGPFGLLSSKIPALPAIPGRVLRLQRPYWYEIDILALASGGQGNGLALVQAGRPFLWVAMKWSAYNTAGGTQTNSTTPVPDISASLLIQNEPFSSGPIALTAIAGSPFDDPQELVEPFWIPGTSTIKLSLQNNENAADTYNIRVTFIGFQAVEE